MKICVPKATHTEILFVIKCGLTTEARRQGGRDRTQIFMVLMIGQYYTLPQKNKTIYILTIMKICVPKAIHVKLLFN